VEVSLLLNLGGVCGYDSEDFHDVQVTVIGLSRLANTLKNNPHLASSWQLDSTASLSSNPTTSFKMAKIRSLWLVAILASVSSVLAEPWKVSGITVQLLSGNGVKKTEQT
jgi:hypothetical protein